jgi:hypothetical protein
MTTIETERLALRPWRDAESGSSCRWSLNDLQWLGIKSLWLSPVLASPSRDGGYT